MKKRGRPPIPVGSECPCGCGYRQPKMIRSDWEAWQANRLRVDDFSGELYYDRRPPSMREHKFKGGPPPKRLHRMCLHHESRARRHGVPWDCIDLRHVYKHYEGKCGICDGIVDLEVVTIDHIIAIENGGGHVWENLQPAHASCNSRKGHR